MAASATGRAYEIVRGDLSAVVTEVGAHLGRLRLARRDLLAPLAEGRTPVASQGALLCPWPNRIRDGRYLLDGAPAQLPLTEVAHGNAIHGLLAWVSWRPAAVSESSLTLETDLWPQPGYPFRLQVSATYALDDDGLHWTVRARNVGTGHAPYGVGIHPYLVPGAGGVDDWTLRCPGSTYLTVDERLIPTGEPAVDEATDLRAGRALAGVSMDRAYHLCPGEPGRAELSADGTGIEVSWDPAVLPWVQVFTTDIDAPFRRAAVAIEPMSCPANAFNSGTDLVRLGPGQEHEAWWRICPV